MIINCRKLIANESHYISELELAGLDNAPIKVKMASRLAYWAYMDQLTVEALKKYRRISSSSYKWYTSKAGHRSRKDFFKHQTIERKDLKTAKRYLGKSIDNLNQFTKNWPTITEPNNDQVKLNHIHKINNRIRRDNMKKRSITFI
jgi:hypothetical protein